MKLIYIANARIPTEKAHGHQIIRMCCEYAKQGVEVELWVPKRENPILKNAFDYYQVDRNFKIKYFKIYDFLKHKKFPRRLAFYFQSLIFDLRVFFTKMPREAVYLSRQAEMIFMLKLRGMTTVYECHDWFRAKLSLYLFLLKKTDKVVTTNRYIKNKFIENDFFDEDVLVAPNGVDLEMFAISDSKHDAIEKLPIDKVLKNKMMNSRVLLYTGSYKTMGVGKGIEEIILALKGLEEEIVFLAVGGAKKHIDEYKKLAVSNGVEHRVFLLESYNQSDLALFQRASDILLMPFPDRAHYRYHMTPLKMFEYLASARPIVASDLPSIREVLNEENCLFVNPDDEKDLKQKIRHLLENKELGNNLSSQARVDASKYSWKLRAENIINHIKK